MVLSCLKYMDRECTFPYGKHKCEEHRKLLMELEPFSPAITSQSKIWGR